MAKSLGCGNILVRAENGKIDMDIFNVDQILLTSLSQQRCFFQKNKSKKNFVSLKKQEMAEIGFSSLFAAVFHF